MNKPGDKAPARPTPTGDARPSTVRYNVSLLTPGDLYLFNEGSHSRLYQKLGAHLVADNGEDGAYFAVWAPSAARVTVVGDFNGWDRTRHPLRPRD